MKLPRFIVGRILILLLVSVLTGCKPNPAAEFLQGTWYYNDMHLQQVVAEQHLEVFWTFSGNAYQAESCCFNGETYEQGRFRVFTDDKGRSWLELYDREGHNAGTVISSQSETQIQIEIDFEADTVKIGRAVYIRYVPEP